MNSNMHEYERMPGIPLESEIEKPPHAPLVKRVRAVCDNCHGEDRWACDRTTDAIREILRREKRDLAMADVAMTDCCPFYMEHMFHGKS